MPCVKKAIDVRYLQYEQIKKIYFRALPIQEPEPFRAYFRLFSNGILGCWPSDWVSFLL